MWCNFVGYKYILTEIKQDATLSAYILAFRERIFKCKTIWKVFLFLYNFYFIQPECQSSGFWIASVLKYVDFDKKK